MNTTIDTIIVEATRADTERHLATPIRHVKNELEEAMSTMIELSKKSFNHPSVATLLFDSTVNAMIACSVLHNLCKLLDAAREARIEADDEADELAEEEAENE